MAENLPDTTEQPNIQPNDLDTAISNDKPSRNTIDVSQALKLRILNKLSYRKIAAALNCSVAGVYEALQPFINLIDDPQAIDAYNNNRAGLLTSLEMKLAAELTNSEKLKSASLNNVAYAFSQVSKEAHLAKGESTGNFQYHVEMTAVNELDKEIEDLEKRLEES